MKGTGSSCRGYYPSRNSRIQASMVGRNRSMDTSENEFWYGSCMLSATRVCQLRVHSAVRVSDKWFG